jgi:NADPH:quinone reductase-like Zn-dependent oxidoreductase
MKAICCTRYGPPEVLQLQDVEKPIPRNNELCIKIFATTITASDCIVRGSKLPVWQPMGLMMGIVLGFGKPRNPILGMVLSGEIESVGKDVKRFQKGDKVFAFTVNSGTQMRFGTYAEYMCLPEDWKVSLKPLNLTHEQAAAIPYGGMLALHFLKKANVQKGNKVLIYGASGSIGTSAVQLAKYFGANVTGVCSTANLGFVKSLGADTVIDYTKDNAIENKTLYDIVFDAVGKRKSSRFK